MENKKMKKVASTLDTIVKVVGRIIFSAGIVCGVMAILVAIFGEKMFAKGGELSLNFGFLQLYATEALEINNNFMNAYVIMGLVTVMIIGIAVYIASKMAHSVLEPMKNGRPFENEISTQIRKLAWVVLGCGAFIEMAKMVQGIILTKAFDLENIVNPALISKVELNYTIDFGFVFVFVCIMFLSYIFSYGQKLQQESDETL